MMRRERCWGWATMSVVASALLTGAGSVAAQEATEVRVRVVAHDAKIIGSGVGGARVTVRDPRTDRVLASGIQEGGTGSTRAIVTEPVTRDATIYDTEGAAHFTATMHLTEPTVLEFVAEGPLGFPHALQRATKTLLVVPGAPVLGDGLVLELHGFIVELLEPEYVMSGSVVSVRARIRMLCGCTIEPGGLWDADRLEARVVLRDGARIVRSAVLDYAGTPNMFGGSLDLGGVAAGATLSVVVTDPARENFGQSETIVVRSGR